MPPKDEESTQKAAEQQAASSYWHLPLSLQQFFFFLLVPPLTLYGAFTTTLHPFTAVATLLMYIFTGLGITAGYHRLWAHRSYEAAAPLRALLALAGASSFQGSILWWSRHHRAHHRWTDTDKDPYDARKGLFWSHIGWLLFHIPPEDRPRVDSRDLENDPIVMWQHRNFMLVGPFMALVVPTLIAGLGWGDWRGGYIYVGLLRMCAVHQTTFCVNSLAHYFGETSYGDRLTPRDHVITALVTFGEGYHNFHHEFPNDYRNAVYWWQYDPTKWFIWACSCIGLAHGLRRFPDNEIRKGRVRMDEKRVWEAKQGIDWGPATKDLPCYTMQEVRDMCKHDGRLWVVIDGAIIDVSSFARNHPGGERLIRAACGRDATGDFNGGVHLHRDVARQMLSTMRVGLVDNQPEASDI
ncbi:hypothetical protein THASP1DRAFT_19281 [Thamnocephalis sphaerospora]|uniref:Acyl-CoA desaturase n=1 Tax=Thamnocephalis sphaerospora TaxID=78915 RepID=A0A4P9XKA5_9FUNG|nr:hypothetical protein THASP1DRAFT_19281 [Thamnocephalis sphaerospora]|eukprot:RKP05831.1 hypothetical protein THASP1DRAFT_19281 [Thamnocephalis sphaerospora]